MSHTSLSGLKKISASEYAGRVPSVCTLKVVYNIQLYCLVNKVLRGVLSYKKV